ncbi:MAG: tRNA (adenosine(37)-N6)-threonylcarbamoyltransferase complex ATPase subunit type 1 TsaE [Candidatus Harrisonbacteria bacterium CG10_big_fil_rev_8_21_14_0_10_42_17]|uniref:tRNA threonylcarbamoyladenosine biosynthesis protein TsaE n=1 Tax=Candidatus Harrisonbacteria bacterium CG10_big_fil_rev_8_21_14_0_10_42_17 TaxID=1974584 RepID=A0A2M6WJ23_9BACT|nr:MAG: tRNA (adenosine(37)-N6)-threonylcarbamoyltransferase complex ATPase subunit type 1 TsaE [Candidatus Harrisonbacteria bacterium CG10_big_fil_rev_8_21_14_0_10_42_17]
MKQLITSPREMNIFATTTARTFLTRKTLLQPLIITLQGDLGSGKTTFAQGFLRELGVREHITSPTFLLIKEYALRHSFYHRAYHIDCYRLHAPKELPPLSFQDLFLDLHAIFLIEWPHIIEKHIPQSRVRIYFEHDTKSRRFVTMQQ